MEERSAIAVTGASGWIGSRLCAIARERGIVIRPLSRELLDTSEQCQAQLTGCTSLIHLAGLAHEAGLKATDDAFVQANVMLTRRLAEAVAGSSIRRFLFTSSAKVLGSTPAGPADEQAPACPEDAYGRSKHAAETLLLWPESPWPFETVVARPPLVYGPGVRQNFRALLKLADSPWPLPLADARAPRSLIYLDNLVDGLLFLATRTQETRGCFHISDGQDWTVAQLIEAMRRQLGRPRRLFGISADRMFRLARLAGHVHPAPGNMVDRLFRPLQLDPGALMALGWRPAVDFETGLRATIDWHRNP